MSPSHSADAHNSTISLKESPIEGDPIELFEALIELMLASRQGFALFDSSDHLRFANCIFRQEFDLAEDEFPSWAELMRRSHARSKGTNVEADDFEVWLRSAQTRRGKLPYRTIETQMTDGRWFYTTETTLPGGWMLCVLTEISELGGDLRLLRQERDKALKHSWSDELTGLSNRRYLMERLKAIFATNQAARASVVILDIDFFKKINDTHGHDFGDRVLQHFGSVLQTIAGRDDLIGRLGGEEFLLVCNTARLSVLETVFDKLYSSLRSESIFADMPGFSYSCSAGVAIARVGETVSEILKRADLALYRAKADGRDRYVVAD